jgi:hypothetical protein
MGTIRSLEKEGILLLCREHHWHSSRATLINSLDTGQNTYALMYAVCMPEWIWRSKAAETSRLPILIFNPLLLAAADSNSFT